MWLEPGYSSWGWRQVARDGSSGIVEGPDGHDKGFDFILSVVEVVCEFKQRMP